MTCISKVWFAFWQTYQRALRLRHTLIWRKVSFASITDLRTTCPTSHYPARAKAVTGRLEVFLVRWPGFFFNENGRYSEAKSWKIDPKVANRPSCRGLQTGHWQNPGSYSKKTEFGAKIRILGPKKRIYFRVGPCSSHDQANGEKDCSATKQPRLGYR